MNKESVDEAIRKRLQEAQPAELQTNLETVVEETEGTICLFKESSQSSQSTILPALFLNN